MLAILYTNDQITLSELYSECKTGRWVPILVYKTGDISTVCCFHYRDVCKKFVKRNLPFVKNWLIGDIELTENDLNLIKSKWKVEVFDFPRKLSCNFDFEIAELEKLEIKSVG